MKPLIDFEAGDLWCVAASLVPSWYWMAYDGAISFGIVPWQNVIWKTDIEFSYFRGVCVLIAPIARIVSSCNIEQCEDYHFKMKGLDQLVGRLGFDYFDSTIDIESLGCISLGEVDIDWRKYMGVSWDDEMLGEYFSFVMIVRSIISPKEGPWRRLGVTVIQSNYLIPDSERQVTIW
jgi:hypothetical protein